MDMKIKQSRAFWRQVKICIKIYFYDSASGAWKCIRQLSLELHVFGPAKDANYIRLQYSVMKALEDHGFVFFLRKFINFVFLGFKLFDVKESFGRDMSDIKQKITTVSAFFSSFLETVFRRKQSFYGVSAGGIQMSCHVNS